jgi:hypothetical protein
MEGEEATILDNIDHPDYDMDHKHSGILELGQKGTLTSLDFFSFVKNQIHDFKSFRSYDHSINQLTSPIDLRQTLSNNPEEIDNNTCNIMHILHAKHAVMGNTEDSAHIHLVYLITET